jgi:carboxylesterase type B
VERVRAARDAGEPRPVRARDHDGAEQPVVELVQDLWGQFARGGDPGHAWPRYTAAGDQHFTVDTQPAIGSGLDRDVCDFWDSVAP